MMPEDLEMFEINDKFPESFEVICAEITNKEFHEIHFSRNESMLANPWCLIKIIVSSSHQSRFPRISK